MITRTWRTNLTVLVLTGVMVASIAKPALAYKPTDEAVQTLVNKGITFIEGNLGKNLLDHELGATCICALACFSHTSNFEHPIVKKAVEQIRAEIRQGLPHTGHSNYSLGIALILLGSLDPAAYRQETQALLNAIYKNQMQGGGWTYPAYETGDTSQTQFACLGMWMAHRQDIPVPVPVVDKVTNWLIRTQAPDGAFGYQGKDPNTFTRMPQDRTTSSMGVAGTGSLYVCGELLGFIEPPPDRQMTGLPAALKQAKKKKQGPISTGVDGARLKEAIRLGDAWCNKNVGVENKIGGTAAQQCYYMYTVERYWAFRELVSFNVDPDPSWYNSGVEYLTKKQEADGSWTSGNGPAVDTAFAILFLLRSSQKTIQKIVEETGSARFGKGDLPADLTDLTKTKDGKIVSGKDKPVVDSILSMLEDKNTPLNEFLNGVPDQLQLASDPKQRAQQIVRLRRMAISGPFQGRLTAVKTMSRIRDLDNAPALIFAVTDPDPRVARAAIDGLRFLSRKLDAPTVAEDATEQQQKAVAETWKQWYLSVRPDGSLIE
jgi:hypothetical protein